jgi:hypothetical protein
VQGWSLRSHGLDPRYGRQDRAQQCGHETEFDAAVRSDGYRFCVVLEIEQDHSDQFNRTANGEEDRIGRRKGR